MAVEGSAAKGLCSKLLHELDCVLTRGLVEILDVHVGFGDDVVGCVVCQQAADNFVL